MRITAFRAWISNVKKAGVAISRRIREATGKVDAGVGVGNDESGFGSGRGSRAWFEVISEYLKRFQRWWQKSTFERFPSLEAFLRKYFNYGPKQAPQFKLPPKRVTPPPRPPTAEESAKMRDQVQLLRVQAGMKNKQNRRHARPATSEKKKTD